MTTIATCTLVLDAEDTIIARTSPAFEDPEGCTISSVLGIDIGDQLHLMLHPNSAARTAQLLALQEAVSELARHHATEINR